MSYHKLLKRCCLLQTGTIEGGQSNAGSATASRKIGVAQATGEDAAANSTAQAAAAGDALCPKSLQHGVHLSRGFGARCRFHHERAGDTAAARALRVHTVQDGLHAGVEVGETGQQRQEGRSEGTARNLPTATGRSRS